MPLALVPGPLAARQTSASFPSIGGPSAPHELAGDLHEPRSAPIHARTPDAVSSIPSSATGSATVHSRPGEARQSHGPFGAADHRTGHMEKSVVYLGVPLGADSFPPPPIQLRVRNPLKPPLQRALLQWEHGQVAELGKGHP